MTTRLVISDLHAENGGKSAPRVLSFGSLFTGIGGLDLGLEAAGMHCAWQCEVNRQCLRLLQEHWPHTQRFGDMRDHVQDFPPVEALAGGDPCPRHSRARSIWKARSSSPDYSGWFLAVAGSMRPRWVVRENVLARTVDHFHAALEMLGYGAIVVRMDGAEITGQMRHREFVIGQYQASRASIREVFSDAAGNPVIAPSAGGTRDVISCLTTQRCRYDSRDNYIWEAGSEGLRILDGDEVESFSGLPGGWTAGFSETARARMCGNCVMPQMSEWIGARIIAAEGT